MLTNFDKCISSPTHTNTFTFVIVKRQAPIMSDNEDVRTAYRSTFDSEADCLTYDIGNPQREVTHPSRSSSAQSWTYQEIFEEQSRLTLQDEGDTKALDFLAQQFNTEASKEYVQWATERLTRTVHSGTRYPALVSTRRLKMALSCLNLNPGYENLAVVIERLEGGSYENLPLGTFADHWLAFQPGKNAMIPDEVNFDTIEANDVSVVNPNIVLGARFKALTHENKTESFNFAQLGTHLYHVLSPL